MPGGRPKGSTSQLGARASRRNLLRGGRGGDLDLSPAARRELARRGSLADRREEARLQREEAQAIREQARARLESGELCRRDEAIAEVRRLVRLVRGEFDRAAAYLDPGLPPEVRAAAEAAVTTAIHKLRQRLATESAP